MNPATLPKPLASALDRVRTRWLAVRVAQGPVLAATLLLLAWAVQGAVDRYLQLTWETRRTLLLCDAGVALLLLLVFLGVPWWRRLNRERAALLVERELPQFRTSLISAVELASSPVPEKSGALVRQLVSDVAREVERTNLAGRVIKARPLWIMLAVLAVAALIGFGAWAWAQPLSPLLWQRLWLSRTGFPAETTVVTQSGDFSLVAGAEATLAAEARGVIPAQGRLVATYDDGHVETISLPPTPGTRDQFAFTVRNVRQPFTYSFELHDGIGETHRVDVRFPPSLKELRFTQIYPKYTKLPDAVMPPANLRLLADSKLRIEATASSPLNQATLEIKGLDAPVALTPAGAGKNTLATELTVPESGWKAFTLHLEDDHGEPSINDPVYRVEIISDQPPTASLLLPKKESSTVVPSAKVPISFKAGDDFGLRRAELKYRVFRLSVTGVLEPAEEGSFPRDASANPKSLAHAFTWDIGKITPPITPGCTITFWAEAEDTHTTAKSRLGFTTRSMEKTLVIVSEEQKRQELIEQLGERAKELERLYQLQRTLNENTDNSLR